MTTTIISDIKNHRNINILVGDSDIESSWQVVDSDKCFSVRIPRVNMGTLTGDLIELAIDGTS